MQVESSSASDRGRGRLVSLDRFALALWASTGVAVVIGLAAAALLPRGSVHASNYVRGQLWLFQMIMLPASLGLNALLALVLWASVRWIPGPRLLRIAAGILVLGMVVIVVAALPAGGTALAMVITLIMRFPDYAVWDTLTIALPMGCTLLYAGFGSRPTLARLMGVAVAACVTGAVVFLVAGTLVGAETD